MKNFKISNEQKFIGKQSLENLSSVFKELRQFGLSKDEIISFVSNSLKGKDIFTAKFYYDLEKNEYQFESNFPQNFRIIKTPESNEFIKFSFNADKHHIDILREFCVYKQKKSDEFYHYNQSSALIEGLNLLQQKEKIPARPTNILIPTSRGTTGHLNGKKKIKTSFSITLKYKELIYDIIYYKNINLGKHYGKTELLSDVIYSLEKHYPFRKKG